MYFQRFGRLAHIFNKNKFNVTNNQLLSFKLGILNKPILTKSNLCSRPNICRPRPVFNNKNLSSYHNLEGLFIKRTFYLSKNNRALPPILWIVLRSALRVAAMLTGRGIRKWWASLPKDKKSYILNKIKENKKNIMIAGALSCGMIYTYYLMHLVEDPITKRKKFLMFTENQVVQMAMIECEIIMENYKGKLIKSGYNYNNVLSISQRILRANKHLPGTNRKWQVLIVDDKETMNAFVLPSGHIFIFTGMLAVANNQDQLAAVIGHEMAHALLSHSAEIASKTHLLEMLMLLPLVALWTIFPDSIALFSHYVTEYVANILFQLPFTRHLESEADTVGLEMISRACFDPREASVFWKKMENFAEDDEVEWLSTHPSHQTRYKTLNEFMPDALKIVSIHCPKSDIGPYRPAIRI